MTKKNESTRELEDFRASLKEFEQKEFEGRTHFEKLSIKEKLIWLSELNYFNYIVKKSKSNPKSKS